MSLTACANLPAKDTPPPIPVGSPAEDQVAASARPTIRQIEEAKAEAPKTPAPKPVHEPEGTWHLEKHKLKGPGEPRKALLILKVQNKKSPGSTSIVCYNYGDFAIVETKSTSEVGSAELFVRHADPDHKHLCQEGFKGKNLNLKIREGGFSGVAGDYVIVDGVDASEGLLEFQVFSLDTGAETFRGLRHPDREFVVNRKGATTSIDYFAKMNVRCPLAADGDKCWKEALKANKVPKRTPMPDCKTSFEKTKTPLDELVQVTTAARIGNLKSPKLEFIGGPATCAPAP